jgi:hypothetical protein
MSKERPLLKSMIKENLFLFFFKCHYYLHPLAEFETRVVDQKVEKDNNLDIFEMTANTIEPTLELINRQLLIFKRYQMDVKDIKCPL